MPVFPFYKFKCPSCGARVEFHLELAGTRTGCPSCGKAVEVPSVRDSDGRSTWANWSKGFIILIWTLVAFLMIGWVLFFFFSTA